MSAPVIAFFNNKGRLGQTSLVYHLSWMYVELGLRVVVADLDPQANLTAAFVSEDRLEDLWLPRGHPNTIFGCVQPLIRGLGDIAEPHLEQIEQDTQLDAQPSLFRSPLALLVGDLFLSSLEDDLSEAWSQCLNQDERSFRIMSAFWRIIRRASTEQKADVVLVDIGPNLGAINRAALLAADFIVVPLSPDLFSMQGLRNLGPTLRKWRDGWKERIVQHAPSDIALPQGEMHPAGYIVVQPPLLMHRVLQYDRRTARIPEEYRESVLNEAVNSTMAISNDPYCLALLKHYPSLMSLAQEAHKPIFYLKPADGALGAHTKAVQDAYIAFRSLAQEIARHTNIPLR